MNGACISIHMQELLKRVDDVAASASSLSAKDVRDRADIAAQLDRVSQERQQLTAAIREHDERSAAAARQLRAREEAVDAKAAAIQQSEKVPRRHRWSIPALPRCSVDARPPWCLSH